MSGIGFEYLDANGKKCYQEVFRLPDICPHCHRSCHPQYRYASSTGSDYNTGLLEVVFHCNACKRLFFAYYGTSMHSHDYHLVGVAPIAPRKQSFGEKLSKLSPRFVEIVSEAMAAEEHELKLICGVGYRKALEFLIKDYLISKSVTDDEKVKIRTKFLGNCIKENVTDVRIKAAAERAVWLGNDETHYDRIWEDKDLEDLKKLLELTVHWIEMELTHDDYMRSMATKK